MGKVKLLDSTSVTCSPWGRGVYEFSGFYQQIADREYLEAQEKRAEQPGFWPSALVSFQTAVDSIQKQLASSQPGVYFAANPHNGNYGKWNMALVAAGFKALPGCAINRCYATPGWTWQGKNYHSIFDPKRATYGCYCAECLNKMAPPQKFKPWHSADGFNHWEHGFWFVNKPQEAPKIEFDWPDVIKRKSGWAMHNYDIPQGDPMKVVAKTPGDAEKQFARLSNNCGFALGEGLPEQGRYLTEQFMAIAALPEGKKFPKGWRCFLEHGGKRFGHNLNLNPTAQSPCPHNLTAQFD